MHPSEMIVLGAIRAVDPEPLPVRQPGQPLIDVYTALSERGIISFTPDPADPHSFIATLNQQETPAHDHQ